MKKLFLLLLTVSLSLVGMAQSSQLVKITEIGDATSEPVSGTPYIIECNSQQSYCTWMYDNGDSPKGNQLSDEGDPTGLADAGEYIWYFEPVEGMEKTYTVKNYRTGQFLYIAGTGNDGDVLMSKDEQMIVITVGEGDYADYVALKNPDADQWIDMTWAGTNPTTWGGSVGGSRRMKIEEVTLDQEVDPRDVAIQTLTTTYTNYSANLDTYNENVGESYGQYHQADVDAFAAALTAGEEILDAYDAGEYEGTKEEITAATAAIIATDKAVTANAVPYNYTELADGYYVIKNCLDFTQTTTIKEAVYYTQEEADAANAESGAVEGDENYITTSTVKEEAETATVHVPKAMYDKSGTAAWKTYGEGGIQFLWKLEKAADGKNYRLTNMLANRTFTNIENAGSVTFGVADTLVALDWAGDVVDVYPAGPEETTEPISVQPLDIRLSGAEARTYRYAHAGGHGGGAGVSGNIVGWSTSTDGIGATMWYFEAIDDATVQQWMASDYKVAQQMIVYCDSVKNVVPGQITIAKDIITEVDLTKPVITDYTQFSSPYTTTDEQAATVEQIFQNLINEEGTTYWHSAWENGSVAQDVHYLQVALTDDETLDGTYAVRITRRPVSGDQITKLDVRGYSENSEDLTFEDGRNLGTLLLPMGTDNTETLNSTTLFTATSEDRYIRFYSAEEVAYSSGGGSNRGYWHCKKFQIYPATVSTVATTPQATVRATEIAAIEDAIEKYNAGYGADSVAWNADSIAAGRQDLATLTAVYNKIKSSEDAWAAVYVDPANMRTALSTASTTANNIKIGTNPGEWAAESKAATFKTKVDEVQAYNLAGAYTPAQTETYIKELNEGVESAAKEANGIIRDSKWYYIHFASSALYDEKKWDKTGADAKKIACDDGTEITQSPALFSKYLCVAKDDSHYVDYTPKDSINNDTTVVYDIKCVPASEISIGNTVNFVDLVDGGRNQGMDYWRFVTYNDSLYVIQNKATGLYLKVAGGSGNVTVSPNASFFKDPIAIGAGAVLIPAFRVANDTIANTFSACNYLHAQRDINRLVTWSASNLGSNSMMFIEPAEDYTEAPTTSATLRVWPGNYEAYTFETAMKVTDANAKVYGKAAVSKTDDAVNITLTEFTEKSLLAGQPFMLKLPTDSYISWDDAYTADSTAWVSEHGDPELGFDNDYFAQKAVYDMVEARYKTVGVTFGTEFRTEVFTKYSDLKGTFTGVSGLKKGTIKAKNDGFATAVSSASCDAFGAYIDGTAVITTIAEAQMEPTVIGAEATAITVVNADEVAPASQGIYNMAGQKLNKLQKGLNIVNGKKVAY